jgi:hypothetical protein
VSLLSDQKSSHPTSGTGTPDNSATFQGTGAGAGAQAVEGSAMKFVRYVPTRKDSAVTFSLNQMLSDTSHSQSDHSRGGKGVGELGKRYGELLSCLYLSAALCFSELHGWALLVVLDSTCWDTSLMLHEMISCDVM